MFELGLEDEVKNLIPYKHYKALATVGYSELFEYFDCKCTLNEAKEKIKQHTRNYAKRQMTWFRHQKLVLQY
jgi:tRNA dimethylallyltransferase